MQKIYLLITALVMHLLRAKSWYLLMSDTSPCPSCGHQIANTKYVTCPKCGGHFRTFTKSEQDEKGCQVLVVVLFVIFLIVGKSCGWGEWSRDWGRKRV